MLIINISAFVDSFALEMLATKGTTTQLERCGLKTVGSQLKLQRLVLSQMDVKKAADIPVTAAGKFV